MNKRYIVYLVLMLTIVTMTWVFAAEHIVEEKSILSGTITAEHLVVVGQSVKEGDILACVGTITGPAAAARATTDGTVVAVLVKAGDKVKTGDVIAKIEVK